MSKAELMGVAELQQAAWDTRETRVSGQTPKPQIHGFLTYKNDVAESPCNTLRDELIEYIAINKNRLSLSCDGDCYQHHDGVVLYCHSQLLEDNKNNGNEKAKTD